MAEYSVLNAIQATIRAKILPQRPLSPPRWPQSITTGINFAIEINGRQVDAAIKAIVRPTGAENWELNGYAYATQCCQR